MAVKRNNLLDSEDVRVRLKDERMDSVERHLNELKILVKDISNALIGNDINGKKGAIDDINNLKKEIAKLNDEFNNKKIEDVKKDRYTGRLEASFGVCLVFLIGLILKAIFTI